MRLRHSAMILAALALFACGKETEIDHYVLALTWQPAFCESNASRPECKTMKGDDYAAGHLTLHGLWPNDKPGSGPTYCDVSAETKALDEPQTWCELPKVKLSAETSQSLTPRMPGVQSCLDRHEWTKHGTCVGVEPDAYFRNTLRLMESIDQLEMSKIIGGSVGKYVNLQQLIGAFEQRFRAGSANALTFLCDDGGYLTEIRITVLRTAFGGNLDRKDLYLDGPPPSGTCPATIRIDRAG